MFETGGSTIRLAFFWGGMLLFLVLELLASYRHSSVSKAKRWVNNLALTLFNSLLLQMIFSGVIIGALAYAQRHPYGVLNLFEAPLWVKTLLTIAFMDLILYVWHLLNHEVPFLWRFHRVHHTDLNMDVSTATRFHIGELAISAVIKISLIFFLGATLAGLLIFETALVLCAQFHHSSMRVPKGFESIFWILFVPPSMHRIHHSVVIRERNTNYGTIFSVWDRFFGTFLTRIDQAKIRIGVGAYPKSERLNFHHLLWMPLTKPVK